MNTTKTPNPERIFAVVASILERRYSVKIEYTLEKAKEANHEQDCN